MNMRTQILVLTDSHTKCLEREREMDKPCLKENIDSGNHMGEYLGC